jgi:coenzyme PQQ precursor peptide PqqA
MHGATALVHRKTRRDFHGNDKVRACANSAAVISLKQRGAGRKYREDEMAWKTPKIVEVAVGMEINMYACAVRK